MTARNDVNTVLLEGHLKTLKLPMFKQQYGKLARECGESGAGYEEYLERLAEQEVSSREGKATLRRLRQAGFPLEKELSGFDFTSAAKLNRRRVEELFRCRFIEERVNVVLIGPPGVGKTHLAIALGREACRQGRRVKFFTAGELANLYLEAREERQVTKLEAGIRRKDLVVVDELGYLPLEQRGAEHLFSFFSQCYERVSLVVTTNLPFDQWPGIFAGDTRLTGALLDRLTHRVQIVEVEGESYRTRQSRRSREGGAKS